MTLCLWNNRFFLRLNKYLSNRLYKNKEQFPSPWLYFMGTVLWLFNFLWRWNDLFAISAFLELIYLFWANAFTPHMYSLHKNFRIFELYIVFCYQIVFLSFLCHFFILTYLLTAFFRFVPVLRFVVGCVSFAL